jgi:hypothetical protein
MKPFVTLRRFVFSRKSVVVPVVLSVLGMGVGGTFLAQKLQQPVQFANSVNCSPVSCNAAARDQATRQPTQIAFAIPRQINYPPQQPKRVPKSARHNPAPNGATRIIPPSPTPISTFTPTPTPTSTPAPTGQAGVIALIEQVFGPYAQGALQVANCESGYNPDAYNPTSINGSHAEGVFQILYPSTWDTTSESASSPFDASANIHAAYEIFARDGYNWHEWSCAA